MVLDDGGGDDSGSSGHRDRSKEKPKKKKGVEERERIWCVIFLQNCSGFKVEMTKPPLGLVLCRADNGLDQLTHSSKLNSIINL